MPQSGESGTYESRKYISTEGMSDLRRLSFVFACLDFLMIFALSCSDNDNFTDSEVAPRILSRPKRYLIFPEGSNIQLVYCLTIEAYTKDDIVMGLTAALAWQLPTKVDSKISDLLHRRSRSVMFPKIEAFLQSTGLDGRACVMRALCEAAQRDPSKLGKGTFVQELLHAIFTLPRDGGRFERLEDQVYDYAYESTESCKKFHASCQHSIYDVDF